MVLLLFLFGVSNKPSEGKDWHSTQVERGEKLSPSNLRFPVPKRWGNMEIAPDEEDISPPLQLATRLFPTRIRTHQIIYWWLRFALGVYACEEGGRRKMIMAMIGAPIDLEARWGSGQTFDFVGNVLGRRRRRRTRSSKMSQNIHRENHNCNAVFVSSEFC